MFGLSKKSLAYWILLFLVLESSVALSINDPKVQPKGGKQVTRQDKRGTQESPLIIKGDVTTKAAEKSDDERKYEEEKNEVDRKIAKYTGLTVGITFLLVVVTAILAFFTYRLWSATYRLAEDAKVAADRQSTGMQISLGIANANAEAVIKGFNLSREAHIATYRPKIVVRRISIRTLPKDIIQVDYMVVNIGPSCARIIETGIRLWFPPIWPMNIPEIQAAQVQDRARMEAGSAQELPFTLAVTDQDAFTQYKSRMIVPLSNGLPIIFFGYILYIDNSDRPYRTRFLREYDPATFRFRPINDPEYEYQD